MGNELTPTGPVLPLVQQRIFTLRGQQVMIDRDLAELYGVETKRLGEQVKRNLERFPEEFRFQLTEAEKNELVANCDRFESLKHSSTTPYAFTEQGVAMLEADAVDCMVALPGQLFCSTQIPACLWFLARNKSGVGARHGESVGARPVGTRHGESVGATHASPLRDRRGQVLFIDARKMGVLVDRTRRELTDEEVQKIADTYHAWRREPVGAGLVPAPKYDVHALQQGDHEGRPYEDIPGFCKSATLDDIRKHGHVLTPGRYVGAAEVEDDGEPFEEKMVRLSALWREQRAAAAKLDAAIEANLKELGYGE